MTFKNPSIILVRPQLPENIGMVARVMHNFGLKDLIIVSPRDNWLNTKSINSAKKADKILKNIKVYKNLETALKNFTYVVATTNRKRFLDKNSKNDFIFIKKKIISNKKLGILFGPENSGLSNEDLRLSDIIFTIKTNNQSNSLNLSHAVAVMCYKLFELNKSKSLENIEIEKESINKDQLSKFFIFLINNLDKKKFFTPIEKKESMKNNIYAIFTKLALTKKELDTLWGITKKLIK